jgi:hypothetical protein
MFMKIFYLVGGITTAKVLSPYLKPRIYNFVKERIQAKKNEKVLKWKNKTMDYFHRKY